MEYVSEEQRKLLKLLSFCDIRGISVRLFAELNKLESKEEINQLIRTGWISLHGDAISLHPLIREVVINAEWKEPEEQAVNCLVSAIQAKMESLSEVQTVVNKGIQPYLEYAIGVLSYHNIRAIIDAELYENLWCCVSANLQRDDESFILNCARNIDADVIRSHRMLLRLWDISVRMLCEDRNYSEATEMLSYARTYLQSRNTDNNSWAFFYGNIESEYYDCLLYDPDLIDLQERYIDCLLESSDNALHYAFLSEDKDAAILRAEYAVDRTNFFIRLHGADRKKILSFLEQCEQLVSDLPKREPEIEISVHLAYMWFNTIYEEDYASAAAAWKQAKATGVEISYPDLEMIDAIIVPGAEMEVEFGHYEDSIALLDTGIEICEKHSDSIPYMRKKEELLDHIQDVISIQES